MSYGGLYVIITYLPMWFQAFKDVSPLMSGVYYFPSVISTTLSTVGSGFLAIQASLPPELISIGTALVVFSQNFGASVFISLGQTTLENSLLNAPGDIGNGIDALQPWVNFDFLFISWFLCESIQYSR
ncbi:uncharacterized protein CDV56_105512 [Aspergillus thermomutatus]|uniref:Uncharacterized protein n=1 Tax=Aspergillus thermomutatus TaxID=41047 RepID=A0A397GXN7_ASPTH|nr:uncharacterized protein CDV56_105512 [Aspergillus thermomutatus]RHZ55751.1 hypothetical protein CDV56_105512 [Aspergillus thermomutatus]